MNYGGRTAKSFYNRAQIAQGAKNKKKNIKMMYMHRSNPAVCKCVNCKCPKYVCIPRFDKLMRIWLRGEVSTLGKMCKDANGKPNR